MRARAQTNEASCAHVHVHQAAVCSTNSAYVRADMTADFLLSSTSFLSCDRGEVRVTVKDVPPYDLWNVRTYKNKARTHACIHTRMRPRTSACASSLPRARPDRRSTLSQSLSHPQVGELGRHAGPLVLKRTEPFDNAQFPGYETMQVGPPLRACVFVHFVLLCSLYSSLSPPDWQGNLRSGAKSCSVPIGSVYHICFRLSPGR